MDHAQDIEQDNAPRLPWKAGNAFKHAAAGVMGLASVQMVIYGASIGAQAVQSLIHGGPVEISLSLPSGTAVAVAAAIASFHFLRRDAAPSSERFKQAVESSKQHMANAIAFGGGVVGFASLAAANDSLAIPALAGLAASSIGVAATAVRSIFINPAVEPDKEVSSFFDEFKEFPGKIKSSIAEYKAFSALVDGKAQPAPEPEAPEAKRPKP